MSFVVTRDDWIRLVQRVDAIEATAGSTIDDDVIVPADINNIFGARTTTDSDGNTLAKTNIYKATSDGILGISSNTYTQLACLTDSNATPTTTVMTTAGGHSNAKVAFSVHIIQDNYFQVTTNGTATIYWLPIGDDGECEKQ